MVYALGGGNRRDRMGDQRRSGALPGGNGDRNALPAAHRDTGVSETKALQFRFETFNVTNHTNLNLPQTQVDVLNGATISAAKTPRQLQLGLRVEF